MYLCIWKCKWAVEHERYRKEKEESTLIIILGIETKSVCPQFVVSVQPNLWQREFGSHLTHSRAYRGMETSSFFLFINVVHFGVTTVDGFVTSSSDCISCFTDDKIGYLALEWIVIPNNLSARRKKYSAY